MNRNPVPAHFNPRPSSVTLGQSLWQTQARSWEESSGLPGSFCKARERSAWQESGHRGRCYEPPEELSCGSWTPGCRAFFWSGLHFPVAPASTGPAAPLCPPEARSLLSGPTEAGFPQSQGRRWAREEVTRVFRAWTWSSGTSVLQVGSGLRSGLWVTLTSVPGPSVWLFVWDGVETLRCVSLPPNVPVHIVSVWLWVRVSRWLVPQRARLWVGAGGYSLSPVVPVSSASLWLECEITGCDTLVFEAGGYGRGWRCETARTRGRCDLCKMVVGAVVFKNLWVCVCCVLFFFFAGGGGALSETLCHQCLLKLTRWCQCATKFQNHWPTGEEKESGIRKTFIWSRCCYLLAVCLYANDYITWSFYL